MDKKGKIIEYNFSKRVSPVGSGGHVLVPKPLIGKKVNVSYKKERRKRRR